MNTYDEAKHQYYFDGKPVPSVTQICAPLTMGKYGGGSPLTVELAKQRGTEVHRACEDYDLLIPDDEIDISPANEPYLAAWKAFCRDYRPEWLHIEHKMWSPDYAGTADRICTIGGKLAILDIKTTASMDRISKIALACQLYAYRHLYLLEKAGADILWGVQLKKDGTYTIHDYEKIENKYEISFMRLFQSLLDIQEVIYG